MKRYKLREFKIKLEKNVKFENRWCIFGLKNVFYRKGCTFSCCLKHYLVQSTENLELKPSIFFFDLNLFARGNVCIFWREIFKRILFNFVGKKVVRENSVQIGTNFPAKSLSMYTKSFSWHLSNDLTETYLIKLNKNLYLITLSETIKITKKTEYFGESIINQIYRRQDKIMNNFYWELYDYNKRWWNKIQLHKTKTAHAYFWAPYFF